MVKHSSVCFLAFQVALWKGIKPPSGKITRILGVCYASRTASVETATVPSLQLIPSLISFETKTMKRT